MENSLAASLGLIECIEERFSIFPRNFFFTSKSSGKAPLLRLRSQLDRLTC